jgi:hypothetical protein
MMICDHPKDQAQNKISANVNTCKYLVFAPLSELVMFSGHNLKTMVIWKGLRHGFFTWVFHNHVNLGLCNGGLT